MVNRTKEEIKKIKKEVLTFKKSYLTCYEELENDLYIDEFVSENHTIYNLKFLKLNNF